MTPEQKLEYQRARNRRKRNAWYARHAEHLKTERDNYRRRRAITTRPRGRPAIWNFGMIANDATQTARTIIYRVDAIPKLLPGEYWTLGMSHTPCGWKAAQRLWRYYAERMTW